MGGGPSSAPGRRTRGRETTRVHVSLTRGNAITPVVGRPLTRPPPPPPSVTPACCGRGPPRKRAVVRSRRRDAREVPSSTPLPPSLLATQAPGSTRPEDTCPSVNGGGPLGGRATPGSSASRARAGCAGEGWLAHQRPPGAVPPARSGDPPGLAEATLVSSFCTSTNRALWLHRVPFDRGGPPRQPGPPVRHCEKGGAGVSETQVLGGPVSPPPWHWPRVTCRATHFPTPVVHSRAHASPAGVEGPPPARGSTAGGEAASTSCGAGGDRSNDGNGAVPDKNSDN